MKESDLLLTADAGCFVRLIDRALVNMIADCDSSQKPIHAKNQEIPVDKQDWEEINL